METKNILALFAVGVAIFLLGEVTCQQQGGGQQQQLSPCQQTFVNSLYGCARNNSVTVENFVWLITNQTKGSAPANVAAFKTSFCVKQTVMTKCGVTFMGKLMQSQICQPAQNREDQRPLIDTQFRSIIFTIDKYCAHPCRQTLAKDLRQCYSEANLDPQLFLSNSSMSRGAVIGTTKTQVAEFCQNKQSLITCMKQKRDACPDAPMVMQAMGLDIESMDKGISVLCRHQAVYLDGVDCFAEPTDGVRRCQEVQAQSMIGAMRQAQAESWAEDRFFAEFCKIRVSHVGCDLTAWASKQHKSCNKVVLGLRTELECELIPDDCQKSNMVAIKQICHAKAYNKEARKNYNSAPSAGLAMSAVFAAVIGWMLRV